VSRAAVGVGVNLVAAVLLLALFQVDLHGWSLMLAASAIVLVAELVALAVALELRRRKTR